MYLHVFPGNQQRFRGVIGFEKPMSNFCDDFELLAPRYVRAMPDYLALPDGGRYERGATIPIVHLDTDEKYRFTTTGWGHHDTEKGRWEYVRRYDQTPKNLHAVISASYFDILFDAPKKNGSTGVRLRDADGGPLYICAKYWLTRDGFVSATVPFVTESGPKVRRYSDWQPLLVTTEYLLPYLSGAFSVMSEQSFLQPPVRTEPLFERKIERANIRYGVYPWRDFS